MKVVYANPWFKIIKDNEFHYLEEKGSNNGAAILVIDDDSFIFAKVKRPAHNAELIEVPRGYGQDLENGETCALRELFEETGYQIPQNQIEILGSVMPNSAILSSKIDIYLAKVHTSQKISEPEQEVSALVHVPFVEIQEFIKAGNITDGFTLSALALYWAAFP